MFPLEDIMKNPLEDVYTLWKCQNKQFKLDIFIRKTFTFTAIKLFTMFFMCLIIVYLQILNNLSNSNLNVLDITIGSINNHFGRN